MKTLKFIVYSLFVLLPKMVAARTDSIDNSQELNEIVVQAKGKSREHCHTMKLEMIDQSQLIRGRLLQPRRVIHGKSVGGRELFRCRNGCEADNTIDTLRVSTTPVMHCEGCENRIKSNIRFVKGTKKFVTSVPKQTVTIIYDKNKSTYKDFVAAFKNIGYDIKKK